jgi:hypothetical protein
MDLAALLGGIGGVIVVLLALAGAFLKGRDAERAAQARRDAATENLIADKRDELATTDQDDIEQRLRRWQR